MKTFQWILLFTVIFVSCENENDASKIAVSLKSGLPSQYAAADNKLFYEIEAYSAHSTIKRFCISSFEKENGEKTLFETAPNEAKYSYTFMYEVPAFSTDSVPITLTVKAIDNDNNTFSLKCRVTVIGGAQLLQELSGIVMYSALSGSPNAFSLQNPSQVFLRFLADSAMIDVYDNPVEDTENTEISREWRTNTDVMFAKANNFNYSTATLVSIKNTYNASVRDKFVGNLQSNDIILFCKRDSIFGAIQITDIADNEMVSNDYYRFNLKMGK